MGERARTGRRHLAVRACRRPPRTTGSRSARLTRVDARACRRSACRQSSASTSARFARSLPHGVGEPQQQALAFRGRELRPAAVVEGGSRCRTARSTSSASHDGDLREERSRRATCGRRGGAGRGRDGCPSMTACVAGAAPPPGRPNPRTRRLPARPPAAAGRRTDRCPASRSCGVPRERGVVEDDADARRGGDAQDPVRVRPHGAASMGRGAPASSPAGRTGTPGTVRRPRRRPRAGSPAGRCRWSRCAA